MAEAAHPEANIIFGAMVDEKLEDEVWITVVATGYGDEPAALTARGQRASAGRATAGREPRLSRARPAWRHRRARSPEFLPPVAGRHAVESARVRGVVAAGHPLTAEAGAEVLREGGNAVDAAVAAVLMSFVAESPLTGPGAGGFMLVHTAGGETTCSTSSSPRRPRSRRAGAGAARADRGRLRRPMQVFNIGPSSCGASTARRRAWRRRSSASARCRSPSSSRRRPRGRRAKASRSTRCRRSSPDPRADPHARRRRRRDLRARGQARARGDELHLPELGDLLDRLGAEGPGFLYEGDVARAVERLGARARRPAHARRPRRLRGGRARARAGRLSRPRGAHQPAAVVGRDPDRRRARAARRASTGRATCATLVGVMASANAARDENSSRASHSEGYHERFLARTRSTSPARSPATGPSLQPPRLHHARLGHGRRRRRAPA